MEGLIILAVLYAWFSVIRKAVQGQKARSQQNARRGTPAGAQTAPARAQQTRQPKQPKKAAPTPVQQTQRPAPGGEGMSKGYTPMQTHMSELLKEEEALRQPTSRQAYAGSLGGESQEGAPSREGEDVCDPSLSHGVPSAPQGADSVYQNAIGDAPALAWNSASLLQGVVMSEILKRPGERKWGRV